MNVKLKRFRQKLGIKVKKGRRCSAEIHTNTLFLDKEANDYDVAHEISHIICGWGCCREHCEWEAHGGAKVLCKLFEVDKKQIKDAEERMDCYAHRTNPEACGRYKEKNSWVKDVKKEERMRIFDCGEFMKSNQSGKFLVNPSWLEYLLNLFSQGYIGELWEEIQDTKINHCESIEKAGYSIINLLDLSSHIVQKPNKDFDKEIRDIKNYPKYVQEASP